MPRKNIKLLKGKPLIQYTIDAAKQSGVLNKIMVSTDDEEIADISVKLGAEVPELRPAHLADDKSPTIDTVLYTIDYYESLGERYDAVMLLQPTAPGRTSEDIQQATKKYKDKNLDSLVSVLPTPHEYNPYWSFEEKADGILELSVPQENIISRRQELPVTYFRSGDIYMTSTKVLRATKSLYGKRLGFHVMRWEDHINIDTMEDWEKAKNYFNEK